ncbi:MAG TPA: MTH938/NDUFAF3 family protein [Aestuariivirga sp.]|nr:MTH938/NDUFAF3 family protein [Aestuariivirga sp.]
MTPFFPGRPEIDAYGNGGFRFAGMSHRGSILALPSGIYGWDADGAALTVEDFAGVFAESAEIDHLLLGTGRTMARPPRAVARAFDERGIMLEAMATGVAISTYNLLLAERRKVAAALIAVEIVA